jgi:hypothetical protein
VIARQLHDQLWSPPNPWAGEDFRKELLHAGLDASACGIVQRSQGFDGEQFLRSPYLDDDFVRHSPPLFPFASAAAHRCPAAAADHLALPSG